MKTMHSRFYHLRKSAQSVDEANDPQISQMDADSRKGDLR